MGDAGVPRMMRKPSAFASDRRVRRFAVNSALRSRSSGAASFWAT